jgi:hypothetical protein
MKSTNLQKGCYKLYQRQMADALNDSGQTLRAAIEAGKLNLDTPWTEYTFQQIFTDNYLARMYPQAEGISDLSSIEIADLHRAVDHGVSQVFNISKPFPSDESLMEQQTK